MTPLKFKKKYKQLLSKENLTKEDLIQFEYAISLYKTLYPRWREFIN